MDFTSFLFPNMVNKIHHSFISNINEKKKIVGDNKGDPKKETKNLYYL